MIKDLIPKQVVCNEKDGKGKPCHGGLKRYYPFAGYYNEPDAQLKADLKAEFGADPKLVLLKCETCATLYRLPPELRGKFA